MKRLVAGAPRQLILASAAALLSAVAVVSAPTGSQAAAAGHAPPRHDRRLDARPAAQSARASWPAARSACTPAATTRFRAQPVQSSSGLQYVPYERTYKGLPVVGGDFVVATDSDGNVLGTTVAQSRAAQLASVTPTVGQAAARAHLGPPVRDAAVGATRLVVLQRAAWRLAWETLSTGTRHGGPRA